MHPPDPAWIGKLMTWWALPDSSASTSLRTHGHEPANRVLALASSTSYAHDGARQAQERSQWVDAEAAQLYTVTVRSSPSLRTSQRCHGTCPGGTAEHRLLPSGPHGRFWKGDGPVVAGSRASGLPSTKQCSPALPFTQINPNNTLPE